MAQTINTNVASLTAQRNLNSSSGSLATSLQRLSSGLRINSAKDDAAGLAISSRMTSQINGLNQAARNANDGISLAQTAEGALNSVSDSLQRMRELSVQAANATNSASDRASIQKEVDQLVDQINTVATQTSFNGTKLLDGSFTAQTFQVGANKGETIDISSIASSKADALGVGSNAAYSTSLTAGTAVDGAGLATAGALTINGHNIGASTSDGVSSAEATGSGIAIANAINAQSGDTGVTATVGKTANTGTATGTGATATGVTINGVAIGDVAATTDLAQSASDTVAAINAVKDQTGVTATITDAATGAFSLEAADGRNIVIADDVGTGAEVAKLGLTAGTSRSTVSLSSTASEGITIGGSAAGLAAAGLAGEVGENAATMSASSGVASIDLTTAEGAENALATIDAALQSVNASRADLGAIQNRFSNVVSNLATSSENISAARGRITDTDFAAETANLSRAQILQQAGTAMLAQANALPQNVLSLLG